MKRAMVQTLIWLVVAFALAMPASADDEKFAVLSEIFSTVVNNDGYLTREMHERYWSTLPAVLDEGAPDYKEFWSHIDGKVNVVTHRYILAATKECMEALIDKDTDWSAHYKEARGAFLGLAENGEDSKKLQDAVNGWDENIKNLGGQGYRPDNKTKDNVIEILELQMSNAEAALHRYETLRRPDWKPATTTRKYRSMPVAVEWPGEFNLVVQKEKKLKARMLFHSLSATDQVKVIHYRMGKRTAKFYKKALPQMINGALEEYNATGTKPEKEMWRGLLSYKTSGNGDADGVPANLFIRFLPSPDGNGVLGLYAMSFGEDADASANFERLHDAVLFD